MPRLASIFSSELKKAAYLSALPYLDHAGLLEILAACHDSDVHCWICNGFRLTSPDPC
jgi:hypothetical protein